MLFQLSAGYEAVAAGVDALFGHCTVGLTFAKTHFDKAADDYALECIALCQGDIDLINSSADYLEAYGYALEGLQVLLIL